MPVIQENQYRVLRAPQQDVFVFGQIECENGGRGHITCNVYDPAGNVIRSATVSAHFYRESDSQIRHNALSMIVRSQNERYSVAKDETNPVIRVTFWEENA
jgi:hypothetical protein